MFEQLYTTILSADLRHLLLLVGCALTLWAATTDLRQFRIPNAIPAALVVGGTVWVLVSHADPIHHLLSAIVVLVLGFALYAGRFLGAGDAKLMAALALWFGPAVTIAFVVKTTFFGAGLALLWLRSGSVRVALSGMGFHVNPDVPRHIPYGVAIAGAGVYELLRLWPGLTV